MSNKIIIAVVAVLVFIVVGFMLVSRSDKQEVGLVDNLPGGDVVVPTEGVQFCTQEAKLCSDGSYVSRTGAKCEFAKCPDEIIPTQTEYGTNPAGQYVAEVKIRSILELGQYLNNSISSKFVLFFHAPWCPFCKEADKEFSSRKNDIPPGVAVIRVDYDSNAELKKKYGVTYQHTFVQVDREGNQIIKWNGGDLENLKKYLK